MPKKIYVVYDNKAEDAASNILMLHGADAVAIREFTDIVTMDNSRLGKHGEDYDLWCLGELNVEGKPEILSEPRKIVNAATIINALNSKEQNQ